MCLQVIYNQIINPPFLETVHMMFVPNFKFINLDPIKKYILIMYDSDAIQQPGVIHFCVSFELKYNELTEENIIFNKKIILNYIHLLHHF